MDALTYTTLRSPIGRLTLVATDRGLCAVCFPNDDGYKLPTTFGEPVRDDRALAPFAERFEAYFAHDLKDFDIPLDLSIATPFQQRVLRALARVGYGELTSYGELARRVGTGPRAVGGAVGRNPLPIVIGCHRVIAGDGSLGGFGGGLDTKRYLLALEGHEGLAGGWEKIRRR
ncbi:MAG TPA: methylated-DNA--[protein]-cysteine S-methyltransferase [Actinomycetota bacterium]|nr:methylated-DNA--[protein]-cysteine S-methyltransferase [Actinomycetota bacterium]